MKKKLLSRRKFLGLSSTVATAALLPASILKKAQAIAPEIVPGIAVVKSVDYYKAAMEAVNALGGMSKFVKKNSKVGLLINGNFDNEGTFTNPDISFAVLKMCFDAGAREVMVIKADKEEYWKKSAYYNTHRDFLLKSTRSAGNKKVTIERGKILKEAEMVQELFEFDTLINIPISKHHDGAYITCCLKNVMGLNTRSTNVLFHSRTGEPPADSDRLARCIADINTVRMPDLTVVDSTRFILNNGPHGPGEIHTENKVLAGTDAVALDAYCANFFDLEPGMVLATEYAAAYGLGESDLTNIRLKEIELD
jgi:uncharacterized protein (DUF362 family)